MKRTDILIDDVPDAVFSIDVNPREHFKFASVSPSFLVILGLNKSHVIEKFIEEMLPKTLHTQLIEKCRQAIAKRSAVNWLEESLHPYDESTYEVTIVPIFDNRGRCNRLVGVVANRH